MTGTLSLARQMCHALCAITASDSGCPCNYKYFRSCFSTSLSHTHPSLPPLCQPGNPGIQVTTSTPPASTPAFLLFLSFLWMSQLWWTAPTFVFLLPFFYFTRYASLSPFLLVPSFVMTSLEATSKVNDATALLWGKHRLQAGKCHSLLLYVRHFNEGNNLQI